MSTRVYIAASTSIQRLDWSLTDYTTVQHSTACQPAVRRVDDTYYYYYYYYYYY